MTSITAVDGTVEWPGGSLGAQTVLLVGRRPPRYLSHGSVSAAGRFRLAVPVDAGDPGSSGSVDAGTGSVAPTRADGRGGEAAQGPGVRPGAAGPTTGSTPDLAVLVVVRAPFLGAFQVPVLGPTVDVEARPSLNRLDVHLGGSVPAPMTVSVDPVLIEGVDEELTPLLFRTSAQVADEHLLSSLCSGNTAVEVMTGSYRVGAWLDADGPLSADRPTGSWAAGAHDDLGRELPGGGWTGYTVEVRRDMVVTLSIAPSG